MKHVKVLLLASWLWAQSLAFLPSISLIPTKSTTLVSPNHPRRQFTLYASNQERQKSKENKQNQEFDPRRIRRNSNHRPKQSPKGWHMKRGQRSPRRRSTSRREESFKDLLKNLQTSNEIDEWMGSIIENQQKSDPLQHLIDPSWNSRDQTDFIRYLRDRGAFKALELFAYFVAKQNVYVYTAVISSLANSRSRRTRKRAVLVLDRMDEVGVKPSSFTFAALFQSIDGPEEASKLMTRLQKYRGKIAWSVDAFNQAIIACGRRNSNQPHPTNKGWQIALEFLRSLRANGLTPDWKTYSSLLNVLAQTGQLKIALSLAREIESLNPSKQSKILAALLNVAAQAGDFNEANRILTKMQTLGHQINLAHCSAFLKALSRHGLVKSSFRALDMMTLSNRSAVLSSSRGRREKLQLANLPPISPDLVALNTVLACCANAEDFQAARHLLDCMKNGEFRNLKTSMPIYPDEISYSLLLSSCTDPMEARAIVKEMQLSRRYRVGVVRPSNITYARAIAVCRKAEVPDVETARFFLTSARNDGVEPTVYMYTAAIWTAERSGNFTFASEILEEMKSSAVEPNSISYSGAISAAARCGLVEEAVALFEEFRENGKPSALMYNGLAMAVKHSQASNKIEILEDIYAGMNGSERFVEKGGAVMEALINEYGNRGQYENASKIFESIRGPSDEACLRAILKACATADSEPKWAEAVSILHSSDITRSSAGCGHIDQGALSHAMIACAKADRWEEGLNLLLLYGAKARRSHSLSTIAMNAMIAACGRNGRPDVAVSILNEMGGKYGVKPDERSYRSAIIACNQAEHNRRRHRHKELSMSPAGANNQTWNSFQWWECALALLRRMKESGLNPDIQTLSSCISACEAAGQWQRALGVLQSMIDENSGDEKFLNLFCFNAAISSCEKGGAWVEALEIYERMISYGGLLQPNFVTLSSLVLALRNAGQKELAESKYEEGMKMKIVNPWRTTRDAQGRRIKAMDLHRFNSAMACSAVRSHIDSFLRRGEDAVIDDDLVIIVGKGLRSSDKAKLLPAIQHLLFHDYGLSVEVDAENRGRIIVDANSLRGLIANRSWR